MENDRGSYGDHKKRRGVLEIGIVVGLAAAIYGFSPGARHWYRHGRLPDHRR